MCGIVGAVFAPQRAGELNPQRARSALAARGPDGWGEFAEPGIFLGHARLAIIDVSARAAQPMASDDGRYVIVFNGEIYNFHEIRALLDDGAPWRTQSDTETLLRAWQRWGIDCLQRLHGMFAFALWDRQASRLLLARDRLGVKPLYYLQAAGVFAFASRPGALTGLLPGVSLSADRQAIRTYLEAGYIPAPRAFHSEVRKLEPGHRLEFELQRGVQVSRWWTLDDLGVDASLERAHESDLVDQLEGLVDRSVRWRMVSDVALGAFLSGGIDSSLVAALMARHSTQPIRTFTIGFDDAQFDESDHARQVAQHLGAQHSVEMLRADDLLSLMPEFTRHYDEPFFDYAAFPMMAVSRLARRSVQVSLSGDGGDEAFGGYHYYRIASAIGVAHRLPAPLRVGAGRLLSSLGGRWGLLGHALRQPSTAAAFAFSRSVIKDAAAILAPSLAADTISMAELFEQRANGFSPGLCAAEQGMRLDIAFTLPDDYLQKVDVGSMAFSIEARDPLLEHSIFEWAARLPLKWKIRGRANKYLLRQLAFRHVPRELLDRPKMGFGVPMARWLREGLRDWGAQLLDDTGAMQDLELQPDAVRALWREHQAGHREAHTTLWAVLALLQFRHARALENRA